jgi:hypothetical protein
MRFGVFCWGFCEKRAAKRGFLMVNSWWDAGKSWHFDGRFSGTKNMPAIRDLFLGDSCFGNGGRRTDRIAANSSSELQFDCELCGAGSA